MHSEHANISFPGPPTHYCDDCFKLHLLNSTLSFWTVHYYISRLNAKLFFKHFRAVFALHLNYWESGLLKFMFSKKATKFDKIFSIDLMLCSNCQIDGEDFVAFLENMNFTLRIFLLIYHMLSNQLTKLLCLWLF